MKMVSGVYCDDGTCMCSFCTYLFGAKANISISFAFFAVLTAIWSGIVVWFFNDLFNGINSGKYY